MWHLSWLELFREFEAAERAEERKAAHTIALAWNIENFRRHNPKKSLPDLKGILRRIGKGASSDGQTVEQQRMMLEILSAQYGGKLRQARDS